MNLIFFFKKYHQNETQQNRTKQQQGKNLPNN